MRLVDAALAVVTKRDDAVQPGCFQRSVDVWGPKAGGSARQPNEAENVASGAKSALGIRVLVGPATTRSAPVTSTTAGVWLWGSPRRPLQGHRQWSSLVWFVVKLLVVTRRVRSGRFYAGLQKFALLAVFDVRTGYSSEAEVLRHLAGFPPCSPFFWSSLSSRLAGLVWCTKSLGNCDLVCTLFCGSGILGILLSPLGLSARAGEGCGSGVLLV